MNHNHLLSMSLIAIITALLPRPTIAWEGRQDNKPVAELQLMTEQELADEARGACSLGAIKRRIYTKSPLVEQSMQGYGAGDEATAYLHTIEVVVRARHQGKVPPWLYNMKFGLLTNDEAMCVKYSSVSLYGMEEEPREKAPTEDTKPAPSAAGKGKKNK